MAVAGDRASRNVRHVGAERDPRPDNVDHVPLNVNLGSANVTLDYPERDVGLPAT